MSRIGQNGSVSSVKSVVKNCDLTYEQCSDLTTDITEFTDESHWPEWIRVLCVISG